MNSLLGAAPLRCFRWLVSAVCLSACVALSGCREPESVRTETLPRDVEAERSTVPDYQHYSGAGRLLGAMLDHEDSTWVFKTLGPAELAGKHASAIQLFVTSTQFVDGKPRWKIPQTWREVEGSRERYVTYLVDATPPVLEVAITRMGRQDLIENVNRWRGQVGQPPLPPAEAAQTVEPLPTLAGPAYWVDVSGTYSTTAPSMPGGRGGAGAMPPGHPPVAGGGAGGAVPAFGGKTVPAEADVKPTPHSSWRQIANDAFSSVRYEAGDPLDKATIAVSVVGGAMPDNIDRWYKQVGIQSPTKEQIAHDKKPVTVDGVTGIMFELRSPPEVSPPTSFSVAAIPVSNGQHWFFKITGSPAAVEAQRAAFQQFLNSIRFE